jgi:broad specificity phosphatase PhoE
VGRIILVRHADAGGRQAFDGPDAGRPLSKKGWKQARRIAASLGDVRFDRLLSGPATRCRQTLEPLAEALGLDVDEEPMLNEGAAGDVALDTLLTITDTAPTIAACSHGDVIPRTVTEAGRRGATISGQASQPKASWYELETDGHDVVAVTYHPPPGT